jgi:hypothetical protein
MESVSSIERVTRSERVSMDFYSIVHGICSARGVSHITLSEHELADIASTWEIKGPHIAQTARQWIDYLRSDQDAGAYWSGITFHAPRDVEGIGA